MADNDSGMDALEKVKLEAQRQRLAQIEAANELVKSIQHFFEKTPPATETEISNPVTRLDKGYIKSYLKLPDLQLHCSNSACEGVRIFEATEDGFDINNRSLDERFVTYVCRNCESSYKTYAIRSKINNLNKVSVVKFGEHPSFGGKIPDKVLKLFGSERDYFLKGRQAENQGLGIAAFAYYRRVIEAKRNVLIDEIIRVAQVLGANKEMLSDLERAKAETQFTKAIEAIKHGIPNVLYINGVNPLLLLHDVLSDGLHGRDDAECLSDATSIRIILTEFVDKLSQAIKDDSELANAVSSLLTRKEQRAKLGEKN